MRRIFVIGNGPSLKADDLTLIAQAKQDSFGVNRVHLIYHQTPWRPTYWIIADRSGTTLHGADTAIHLDQGYPCYVRADIPRGAEAIMWSKAYPETFIPFAECDHLDAWHNPTDKWHFPRLCKEGGSIGAAIQQSVILGYDEIVLLGCDGGIKANSNNHFTATYVDPDYVSGPEQVRMINETLELMHRVARDECRQRGVSLLSATRSGRHWGHPQVALEDYLT